MVKRLMDRIAQGGQIAYYFLAIIGLLATVYLGIVGKIDEVKAGLQDLKSGQALFEQRLQVIEQRRSQADTDHDTVLKMQGTVDGIAKDVTFLREVVQRRGSLTNPFEPRSTLAQEKQVPSGP